jgi:hypothetical protein
MDALALTAAIEHVANAVFDVLIPALFATVFGWVRIEWMRYKNRNDNKGDL